jgi:hypothetical protein
MARCQACGTEMTNGPGCTQTRYGTSPRVPHAGPGRCHDCDAPAGKLHHPGCDAERCPDCGGQAISCPCGEADEAAE